MSRAVHPSPLIGLDDPQPHVDAWPQWDEGLSKHPVVLDIVAARWRLALRFNARLPKKPLMVLNREIDRAWNQHRRGKRR